MTNPNLFYTFMKLNQNTYVEAEYASKIILKEIAARKLDKAKKWYDGIFTDRRIAKDIEDRARKGTLGFKSASQVLPSFGYEIHSMPMESMWRPIRLRKWEIIFEGKVVDEVTAYTEDEALIISAVAKFGKEEMFTDFSGDSEFKWFGYKCRLTAREVD